MIAQVWQDDEITDPTHTLIMLALADYANDLGVCWPAWESIGKKARCSRSTVWRIVKALVALKKITVESGGGKHHTNTYRFNLKPFHPETVTPSKQSHPETKGSHPETQTVSQLETRSVSTRHDPPKGEVPASQQSGSKGLTAKDKFWMTNEQLKTAKGPAKRKLEAEREAAYQAATGVDLPKPHPKPIVVPLALEPIEPADEATIQKSIAEAKAAIAAAPTVMPMKPVLRQVRFKRPPKAA